MLPDPYFYVYKSATLSIITNFNISQLPKIFDNFASSPGTPILYSIYTLLSNLSFELVVLIMSTLQTFPAIMLAWMVFKYHNIRGFSRFFVIFGSGFTVATSLTPFGYGTHSYILLIFLIMLLSKHFDWNYKVVYTSSKSLIIVEIILSLAIAVTYLPLTIFAGLILISSLIVISINSIGNITDVKIKHLALYILAIVLPWFIYMAYYSIYFRKDFVAFMHTLVNTLLSERSQSVVREVLGYRFEYFSKDYILYILYISSLLRFVITIMALIYVLLYLFSRIVPKGRYCMIASQSFIGSIINSVGVFIYAIVSHISDYGTRLFSLSLYFIFTTATLLSQNRDKVVETDHKQRNRRDVLTGLILLLLFISSVGWFSYGGYEIYRTARNYDLALSYTLNVEAFTITSIANTLLGNMPLNIYGTYRYIYFFSSFNKPYLYIRQETDLIGYSQRSNTILLVPTLISEIPDSGIVVDTNIVISVIKNGHLVLNTGITNVILTLR